MGSPNVIAYAAFILWIPFCVYAFRKLRPGMAGTLTVLGGILFLPEVAEINLPALPPFGKAHVTSIGAIVGALVAGRGRGRRSVGFFMKLAFIAMPISAACTALANTDVLRYGSTMLPGLGLYDAFQWTVTDVLVIAVPFYLGQALIRSDRDLQDLWRILIAFGLIYVPLVLFEIRMSPQLHRWIYGAGQLADFQQARRGGGFRPMVFTAHGLALAMFLFQASVASTTLTKIGVTKIWKLPMRGVAVALPVILILCKSLGAALYMVFSVAMVWLTKPKNQVRVAAIMGVFCLLYPTMRASEVFPAEALVDFAKEHAGEERAQSLEFRFENEAALVRRAQERFIFGWGKYGRASVFDMRTGEELAVRDGAWIIHLGERGLVGFFWFFGLLLGPVFMAARRLRRVRAPENVVMFAALTLVTGISTLDLLPNGLFNPTPFFLAGALYGLMPGRRT